MMLLGRSMWHAFFDCVNFLEEAEASLPFQYVKCTSKERNETWRLGTNERGWSLHRCTAVEVHPSSLVSSKTLRWFVFRLVACRFTGEGRDVSFV